MENIKISNWLKFFIPILILSFLVTGCEKDEDNPPQLPPESTMIMDFSDFLQSQKSELTMQNWLRAATHVAVWNVIITVNLAIPVAAFKESFNNEAAYLGNNEWVWTDSVNLTNTTYYSELHGILQKDSVRWEMYITEKDVYDKFLWYYGLASYNITGGYWIMYNNPDEPAELLRIDWTRDPADETGDIKYTNIVPGGNENGSYIYYGRTGETDYDLFYDIYSASHGNTIEIEWNQTTKEGHIKDPRFFGDEDWHCWDSDLQDIQCD